jgi:hypothetical protein
VPADRLGIVQDGGASVDANAPALAVEADEQQADIGRYSMTSGPTILTKPGSPDLMLQSV